MFLHQSVEKRNFTEDVTACVANWRKQVSLNLKNAKSLDIKINNLDKARVELKDLVHKSWKTIVLFNDLIPRITTFISFSLRGSSIFKICCEARSHSVKLVYDFMSNHLEECGNQNFQVLNSLFFSFLTVRILRCSNLSLSSNWFRKRAIINNKLLAKIFKEFDACIWKTVRYYNRWERSQRTILDALNYALALNTTALFEYSSDKLKVLLWALKKLLSIFRLGQIVQRYATILCLLFILYVSQVFLKVSDHIFDVWIN